jgi:hypothetical protein
LNLETENLKLVTLCDSVSAGTRLRYDNFFEGNPH